MKCRYLEPSFKKSDDNSISNYQTEYLCKLKMGDFLKTRQLNLYLTKSGFEVDLDDDSCNFYNNKNTQDCPIREWTYPSEKSQ